MDLFSYLLGKKAGGGGVTPTGTINITENGTVDVTNYATANVSVSGGGGSTEEKDVNFYDYDGTLVKAYTKNEFLALETLPENPTHDGLTADGWNWELADAKTYVTNNGILDIGQTYTPTDGKVHIFIKLDKINKSPYLGFAVNGTATINWGDGNSEDVTGSSTNTVLYTQHNYTNGGEYEITIDSTNKLYFSGSSSSTSYLLVDNNSSVTNQNVYQGCVKKIYLNNNCECKMYAFQKLVNMESIVIPSNVTYSNGLVAYCYSLKNIVIPSGNNLQPYICSNCFDLKTACLPKTVNMTSSDPFSYCTSLTRLTCSSYNATSCSNGFTTYSTNIEKIVIPNNLTTLGGNFISNNNKMKTIKIPNSITTISGSSVFNYCKNLQEYDFTSLDHVPTLSSNSAFSYGFPAYKIIVPDSLYSTWVAADKWSGISSHIIKASEV